MKKTVLIVCLLCFGLNCICPSMGLINVFAEIQELTPQTLKNDLAYYHKVSKKGNFTYNEKLYLLLRIKDKYKESPVNLSDLEKKIALVESEIKKSKKKKPLPSPKVEITTTTIQPGDIVEIPKKPKRISVTGEVREPGNYTYEEGMKALDAISIAGGPSPNAKLGSIKIFREISTQRKVYKLNLKKVLSGRTELDIRLLPGDIILVPRKTIVSGKWFVSNILPWLSLVALILAIRGGLGV